MTRLLEVEENGTLTLTAEVLGKVKPHTRYRVETRGTQLTLQPESPAPPQPRAQRKTQVPSTENWEQECQALSEELGKVWPEGVSVVEVIAEMRC